MIYDFTVPVPAIPGKVYIRKTKSGPAYVEYEYERVYNKEKKYNTPKRKPIGKLDPENPEQMFPNENYYTYFPDAEIPEDKISNRSACLRMGAYCVIKKIICDYGLDELLRPIIGRDTGLLLDLASYSIICENNAGQYYPDYAFNHPLFTDGMRLYSDSKVSEFLHDITRDQSVRFMNKWNERHDKTEKVYISYDSTNKICQAGDIELVEFSRNAKSGNNAKPVFNYAVAYDTDNREPLFYEDYPGSIVDVSQLQYMISTVKGYGYTNLGFILDRGYFSKDNIRAMDKQGYPFVMMVKGQKKLVNELILHAKGTFEEKRSCAVKEYGVYGTTITHPLYKEDTENRYFHIFYNPTKNASERNQLEESLRRMGKTLEKMKYTDYRLDSADIRYFDPIYSNDE